jgi:two-component system, cell cycle response regulator
MTMPGKDSETLPILVVDDDPISSDILRKYLEEEGYTSISATNGQDALELYQRSFFSIIITDWLMPKMDGTDLCRAIRNMPSDRYTYIILLTARDSQNELEKGLESGADEYLVKPVHQAELRLRLKGARRILELENTLKRNIAEIRELSIRDPLTGSFNRGYMDEQLVNEINRVYRYEHPLSVILGDIDHFKRVNDTFGHLAGDEALRKCAATISISVRRGIDWLARYGGEEFVIVLPETDRQGCMVVAERIRRQIESQLLECNGKAFSLTISFGAVTVLPGDFTKPVTMADVLILADSCLYTAKNEGRNRVVATEI